MQLVIDDLVGSTGLELKVDPGVPYVYAGFAGTAQLTCYTGGCVRATEAEGACCQGLACSRAVLCLNSCSSSACCRCHNLYAITCMHAVET